ncbi:MAG TPA: aminoglycoside phosphotransferase family protein [Planctomycetota bacterium]|nr:aminoglycoside phosphotransferase family protein [Planctomycetota bacterium]
MHADELPIDVALARTLIDAQFPRWAALPLEALPSAGTDHALFRLGGDMVVRMPRLPSAAAQVAKEQAWLPRLSPHLPLAIPVPLAMGGPGEGYPCGWSVCCWIDGEVATLDRIADPQGMAADLARFLLALRAIDPTGGPWAGDDPARRGAPLATRDGSARQAISDLRGTIDEAAATAAWNAALEVPPWPGAPVWVHGDLLPLNLLARGGRLVAVLDFGLLAVGDPASDVMAAWTCLPPGARDVFRSVLGCDDATWARGRGWALWSGLVALPYYRDTNPPLAAVARRAIDAVLADAR